MIYIFHNIPDNIRYCKVKTDGKYKITIKFRKATIFIMHRNIALMLCKLRSPSQI